MQVRIYPDPALRRGGKPIEQFDDALRATAKTMLETMYHQRGVGLAAPQVGLELDLLVLNPSGEANEPEGELVMCNPRIKAKKGSEFGEEGCLSFPGLYAEVERYKSVVIVFQDLNGEERSEKFEDFLARVVQHEMDHLQGVVFTDRLSAVEKLRVRGQLQDLEADYGGGGAAADEDDA